MRDNQTDNYKTKSFIIIINSIKNIVASLIFLLICSIPLTKNTDNYTKLIITPFLICGNAVLIKGIITLFQGFKLLKATKNIESGTTFEETEIETIQMKIKKVNTITNKLYIIGFFIFWFGFLIVFDYIAIKDWPNGGSSSLLFSIIFWIVGIFVFINKFKNNK